MCYLIGRTNFTAFRSTTVSSDDSVSEICLEILHDCDILAFCCLLQNTKNSTAYVDNQINTNTLYTIEYKRAKKYNMNQNLAYEKAEMQKNHNGAKKNTDAEKNKEIKGTGVPAHNILKERKKESVWYDLMYKTSNVICISMENI